ncbi:MAG TPA: hypothetical protein VNX29_01940 [Kaistia sp.]|nr:hypothetical protein [Kaistia sp.]
MTEYFIKGVTFAAPFFGEEIAAFIQAGTAEEALAAFVASARHPFGVYAADAFTDANASFKGETPLARWLSNHASEKARLTAGLGSYSYLGHGPGRFEIDGVLHEVADPKGGRAVSPIPGGPDA